MTDRAPVEILHLLHEVSIGRVLDEASSRRVFDAILAGRLTDLDIRQLLEGLQRRGPTVDELVGAARAMRTHVTPINVSALPGPVIDTCGTGGAPKTFNVSTIAALVVAAAIPGRIFVAKHGNRSRTGRGSAEVLSALGVHVDAGLPVQERCLRECGVCFCFAIHHHPAARFAGPARRAIGSPTIFNLLGPLTNPAGAAHQLLGVYDPSLALTVANALARLGSDRSLVVHGHGGMDELSTTGPNRVWAVEGESMVAGSLDASDYGFAPSKPDELVVGSLEAAVGLARAILRGEGGPCRDMVVFSAGVALATALRGVTIGDACEKAQEAIDSGSAAATLASLGRLSNERPVD